MDLLNYKRVLGQLVKSHVAITAGAMINAPIRRLF
jgi:hypothetical protein